MNSHLFNQVDKLPEIPNMNEKSRHKKTFSLTELGFESETGKALMNSRNQVQSQTGIDGVNPQRRQLKGDRVVTSTDLKFYNRVQNQRSP